MAPIADPSTIGLADIFVHRGTTAAHLLAWSVLALFVASLAAIAEASRPRRRIRARPWSP